MPLITEATFPPEFFLYIPSRSSKKDSFSGFIFVRSEQVAGGTIKLRPAEDKTNTTYEFLGNPFSDSYKGHSKTYINYRVFIDGDLDTGAQLTLRTRQWDIPVREVGKTTLIPVLDIENSSKLFQWTLKRNVRFIMNAASTPIAAGGAGAVASPYTPMAAPLTPTITTTTTTAAAITPPPAAPPSLVAGQPKTYYKKSPEGAVISAHVARQLLELAQIKKEMCPVIAEEFIAGETAVMPCGHLFAKIAIQESFKKEFNKCPACRQIGRPTYV